MLFDEVPGLVSGAELEAVLGAVPARHWREASQAGTADEVARWAEAHGFAVQPVDRSAMPYGAWVRSVGEDGYPGVLAEMERPPVLVWGLGTPPDGRGLAAVGSRRESRVGARAAVAAAAAAHDAGVWLVSGHARGCDRHAERAARESGVPVLSVLGGGTLDADAGALIEAGGCVLWEHPGTASGPSLQARNRLVVAAAACVVVCHGEIGSGTARTAGEAVRTGTFLVVPENAGSLAVALAGSDAEMLGWSGEALERARAAARYGSIANAVAATPRELRELAAFAVKFDAA